MGSFYRKDLERGKEKRLMRGEIRLIVND